MSLVLLVIYILTGAQFVQCLKFDNIRCKACHGLAKRIEARLEKTEKRAGEEVGYGNRVGADGKSTSYKKELYENSLVKLYSIIN